MLPPHLELFVQIVDRQGLAAAGRDLGLSPATVSERLAALEAHYGAKLLTRSTRSISLTEEGRLVLDGARRLLAEASDLKTQVRDGTQSVSGLIRLSAPFDLGRYRVAPILDRLLAEHQGLEVELVLSDGYVDLVGRGIDVAVRFGDLKDSSLYTRRIGNNERMVCAAPSYLKQYGTPRHPSELKAHNCLLMRFGDGVDREWHFSIDGKHASVLVGGNRATNDGSLVRQWCIDGLGVALKSNWDVHDDIAAGRLVHVLREFAPPPSSLQIVFTGGRDVPRLIRVLIDSLAENLTGAMGDQNS
jgi:DNA-binding transcriptional LysR family regulator